MPPITLDDVPGATRALAQGDVVVIDDASSSPLIPSAWQRTFSLGSLAVAPLVVDEEPAGLVAVEYDDVSARCTPTQLALLEGMAALAAVALKAGRQRSQAQRLEVLAGTVTELAGLRTTRAIAEQALSSILESAALSTGLFALLSDEAADVVAVRGPHVPEPGRYAFSALPCELVDTCRLAWAADARGLVPVELSGRRLAVLAIGAPPAAAVVLPFAPSLTSADVLGELQLVAAAAAVQLRTARLSEEREWHRHSPPAGTAMPYVASG
jgi:GAF domain-containing protein